MKNQLFFQNIHHCICEVCYQMAIDNFKLIQSYVITFLFKLTYATIQSTFLLHD